MKRFCFALILVLMPSIVWAQGAITVSSMTGPVEIRPASKTTFVHMTTSLRQVQVGDQIRTGDGGATTLSLPDGSYMVVTPNSTVTIQDDWSFGLHNIANVLLGKVRFFIQKHGVKPNPVRVGTPTALIAVRGTTFEVTVDDAKSTEVWCLEGQVGVESALLIDDREVIVETGKKTLVRLGEHPLRPVSNEAEFANRSFKVVQKDPADTNKGLKGFPLPDPLARDNDRGNRPSGLGAPSGSGAEPTVSRGKPALSYPRE